MDPRRRAKRGTSRAKFAAAALLTLVAILLVGWWRSAQEDPVVAVPSPTLPVPNAFLTYNAAAGKFLDSNKVGLAIAVHHTGVKDDHEYSLADKRKLVAENAPALALLRQGLREEYVNPPARSYSALFPYYAQFRALARLLVLEAQVRAGDGDFAGAADSTLDAIEMGEQIPHGSVMIGGLVGIACQAIGRRPLWSYVDRLNDAQARAAVRRLERIRAKQVPFAGTLQEEKWLGQSGLVEIMKKPGAMATLTTAMGMPPSGAASFPALTQLGYLVFSKRRILQDYTRYMDAEIARAKLPFGTTPPTPVPAGPMVALLVPVLDEARLKAVDNETQNALIELALAVRAYRAAHGAYPESAAALAPAILPTIPADPFGSGSALHYRRTGESYVVYSVGPDRTDDGGKPIDTGVTKPANPQERYAVRAQSKGDIVGGKNLY